MARVFRTVTKRLFIVANIVCVAVFLLACCNTFLHPDKWWFVAILGLGFPFLLAFVFAFFIFWLLFRSKWALLSLAALIIGFWNISVLFGFHFGDNSFNQQKQEGALRILDWNVLAFIEYHRIEGEKNELRQRMLDYIRKQDADILCFQEYLEPNHKRFHNNFKEITALGYPYHFKVSDYSRGNGTFQIGTAIFSRFPIVDSVRTQFMGSIKNRAHESLIWVDVKVKDQIIRVFTTHLQSVLFKGNDYRNVEIIKAGEDSIMEASKSIIKKLKQGYSFRGYQANLVREKLDESKYPEIICGDFNDVPNSYTYFRIKGDRQDAFIKTGAGIGRTFSNISPTLRIDYILADKQFEVLQYKCDKLNFSDHYPLVADLLLKPE
jgi:endonuclease/exonuclease/phosphatase family metal-dependent hydrolase